MGLFKGAGVALATPFFEDGSVNYDKLAELVEEQIAGGTDAIIACGDDGGVSDNVGRGAHGCGAVHH